MTARTETKLLIARQIATLEGYVWDKLNPGRKVILETVAENILATVERKLRSCDVSILDHIESEWS